jgi:hypothetical protein
MKTRTTFLLALFSTFASAHFTQASYFKKEDSTEIARKTAILERMETSARIIASRVEQSNWCYGYSKSEFEAEVREADELFANKQIMDAKVIYEKLAAQSNNVYCQKMILECRRYELLCCGDGGAQYAKIIRIADEKYDACDLEKAYLLYERINSIKAGNIHVVQRLHELEDSCHDEN